MPREIRTLEFEATNVNSLLSLLDMCRYDGMRIASMDHLHHLSRLDCGIIERQKPGTEHVPLHRTVRVFKDADRLWVPTEARWRSFGIVLRPLNDWSTARRIN